MFKCGGIDKSLDLQYFYMLNWGSKHIKDAILIPLMSILELRQRGFILDKSLDEINNRLDIERNGKDITWLFFFSLG